MAEAYVVGMVVPQEQPNEEDCASNEIEALFDDSIDGNMAVPATMDEQVVVLLASFDTVDREEVKRQFIAAEREAPVAMLVVRANAVKEVVRMAAQEDAARAVVVV
jgi:hypothetical protein